MHLQLLVIPEYSRHPWRSRCAPPQPAPDLIRGRSRLQSCKRSREAISGTQRLVRHRKKVTGFRTAAVRRPE